MSAALSRGCTFKPPEELQELRAKDTSGCQDHASSGQVGFWRNSCTVQPIPIDIFFSAEMISYGN